jgi:hypothetical protein
VNLSHHLLRLTAELDQKTSPIFDKPNGEVRFVDHVAKRVWVNLGKADSLKPRTTFSVYQKQHSGVGQSAAGKQGKRQQATCNSSG